MVSDVVEVDRQTRPPAGLVALAFGLLNHRKLIQHLAKRDVVGRYRGSVVGLAWSFFNPLLMLAVYTYVFSVIFNARWGTPLEETRGGFAILLFVGMIIHGVLAECANRAPALIVSNANYVKRVVFPLEVLPWVALASALFHATVSFGVLLVVQLSLGHGIPWTAVLLPVVLAPLAGVVIGLTWFISATSVYVRDLAQVTGVLTTALLFLAPVFYPLTSLPEDYRDWIYLNPLTFPIEQARAVLIMGALPDWAGLAAYSVIALGVAWGGFWWFQRTRRGFADVL